MVDTVVITSPNPVAPEGHDQKMIDAVDKANAGIPADNLADSQESPEDRPEWLPEKFKSAEDMAKAYAELESKLGQKPAETPKAETPEIPADPEAALADKGMKLDEFSAEFAKNGELSPESYEKLQKGGFDKALVDQFIEGQQARAAQFESAIKTEVGGDGRYSEMMDWAKANLNPSEIQAYNNAVTSGNPDQAKLAALGLNAKYGKAVGQEPSRMLGGQRAGSDDVFESTTQLTDAMKNPLYKTDPAYRAKVQAKLGRSNVL